MIFVQLGILLAMIRIGVGSGSDFYGEMNDDD